MPNTEKTVSSSPPRAALLTRIKAFFRWATGMEFTGRNPTLMLKAITPDDSQTWPLNPKQFDELLDATYKMDDEAKYNSAKVGQHLRALFLVQRWTGLRVGDVLILPRAALQGNRLSAAMRKKRNRKPAASQIECILPNHAVEALNSLRRRSEEHPGYFFWSRTCDEKINTNKWCRKIHRLNDYLAFTDEAGNPMEFRSHMLRDMFAVEILWANIPLEKVSKLLTHESVTMTERYYAKWTASRRQQLEDDVVAAVRRMSAAVTL
jgi:site-specific recombinase XerD